MKRSTRRSFLGKATAGVTASTLLGAAGVRAAGANTRVRVGVIGCGGQGKNHLRCLASVKGAEIVTVCDVDQQRLAEGVKCAGDARAVTDLRRILDDRSVDAVTIALPDHWHAPATLLALAAGKHVYVEKPCSHNVREGQMLVRAAGKVNKVVQHGTQSRSCPGVREAVGMLRDGIIGDVLVAKAWNWQRRDDIGRATPSAPPAGVDYDTWVGPALWMPYQENRFHYTWHWWYNFGCGGMGNDGIHDVDYALWGLGVTTQPSLISGSGGKYFFDDDQQFPDTQQVTFEYSTDDAKGQKRMLIYEQRLWSTTYPFNVDQGVEYYGTKGKMFLSKRGKISIHGDRNRRVDVALKGSLKLSVADHQQNWIDCIRSGAEPNADIETGHHIATLVHLGNIATRLRRTLRFDPATEQITGDEEASAMLGRTYRKEGHWSVPALV